MARSERERPLAQPEKGGTVMGEDEKEEATEGLEWRGIG